jgi:hydroxymethylbilane synthase
VKLRIGTRGSDLALWQARHVAARLRREPGVEVELVVLQTRGDTIDDVPLQQVEGKAFFTAEIELALLTGQVDVAVHSHKDLATSSPEGLAVVAVPARAAAGERLLVRPQCHDPRAAFLPLAAGARVGTSAPRRREQLSALRPDLVGLDLRGNVPTRVRKLREGRYDAIVLAAAGLDRLGLDLTGLQAFDLDPALLTPAPAQGALAIQTRARDTATIELCRRHLHDAATAACIEAERSVLVELGGGCNLPLGVHLTAVAPAGDGSARTFEALGFLGADQPRPGRRARWVRGSGRDPAAAALALYAALESEAPTRCGPLAGLRVALTGSHDGAPSPLAERLEQLGAEVVLERVIEFEDVPAPLDARLAELRPGDQVAVTSRRAARALAGRALPTGVGLAAVGAGSARALEAAGLAPTHVGAGGAAELARELPLAPGARVLFPCAAEARDELEAVLAARGVAVERLVVYRTHAAPHAALAGDVHARVWLSPSSVDAAADLEARLTRRATRLGMGPATAEAFARRALAHEPLDPAPSLSEAVVWTLARLHREGALAPRSTHR